jgi:hypothetical protein
VAIPQILQRGDAVFEEHYTLPAYVRKAVGALLACRTARLGGHIQACPEGHVERVWYNSCRHGRCAPYVWLQVERWRVRQRPRLLACDHDHVIFTVPDELRKFSLFLLMHFKVGDGTRPAGGYPHDCLRKVCVLENDYTRPSLMFRMLHREKPRSSRHMRIVAERACTVRRRTPCSATWE